MYSGSMAAGGMGAWRPPTAARKPERKRWHRVGAHSVGLQHAAGPHDTESIPGRHRWLWAEDNRGPGRAMWGDSLPSQTPCGRCS